VGWANQLWNGTTWTAAPGPTDSNGYSQGFLQGVSCPSANQCIGVGQINNATVGYQAGIESWNGSKWSIVPSPNPSPTTTSALYSVSCASPSACVAVGTDNVGGAGHTLIESWNGTVWTIVPNPSPATGQNLLKGVSCVAASACTAVGFHTTGQPQALIESWDGTTWSTRANPAPVFSYLQSVSCVGRNRCTAVGWGPNGTLVESEGDTGWSVVPSPNPVPASGFLSSVSCTSGMSCSATGSFYDGQGNAPTLAEQYS